MEQVTNNFCLPIRAASLEEAKRTISANVDKYAYFELWLDYLDGVLDSDLTSLISLYPTNLIFLFRRHELEPIKMELDRRREIIELLSESNLYLDLDLVTQEEDIEIYKEKKRGLKLLLSYHNYQRTPDDADLMKLKDRMMEFMPEVVKFATFCTKEQDALRLLSLLLHLREEQQKAVVLGMGEHGAITRIFGKLWGNYINFTPISPDAATAPGQYTYHELKKITELL